MSRVNQLLICRLISHLLRIEVFHRFWDFEPTQRNKSESIRLWFPAMQSEETESDRPGFQARLRLCPFSSYLSFGLKKKSKCIYLNFER